MAAPVVTFDSLRESLSRKKYSPVYFLHGEEGYYTDALIDIFERIVPEEEKDFNQYVLYAPQTDMDRVIDLCRRCPMMADRQVVILKEAQSVTATQLGKLKPYLLNPTPSTVFVVCCRGAQFKGAELLKAARSAGVVFESKKVNESGAAILIAAYLKEKSLTPDVKAVEMLRDYVGTDLSRLYNEIDKLATLLPKGASVTPEVVEQNIGMSKDFNNYELLDALAQKDAAKVFRISDYFTANPKNNPVQMTAMALFGFFSELLVCQFSPDKSDAALVSALGVKNSWFIKRHRTAMTRYNAFMTMEIIGAIRDFDRKSKGCGSRQNGYDLLRELMFRILTARGVIAV